MTRQEEIEARRLLARYRRLILLGSTRLPLEEARRILGPDCAYHLYFRTATSPTRRRTPRRKTRC
jgi:hypothetical protein